QISERTVVCWLVLLRRLIGHQTRARSADRRATTGSVRRIGAIHDVGAKTKTPPMRRFSDLARSRSICVVRSENGYGFAAGRIAVNEPPGLKRRPNTTPTAEPISKVPTFPAAPGNSSASEKDECAAAPIGRF